MKSIVTLTMNPTVDIAAVAETVVLTSKVRCTSVRYDPGGGGINVARVVHKLGGEVIAVYTAGGAPRDPVDHKKLYRLYKEERLTVRKRGGRKRALGTLNVMWYAVSVYEQANGPVRTWFGGRIGIYS